VVLPNKQTKSGVPVDLFDLMQIFGWSRHYIQDNDGFKKQKTFKKLIDIMLAAV